MIVPDWKIEVARDFGLQNAATIAQASEDVGIWFGPACTLFEKESMGRNVYGHDKGGALSGFPGQVNAQNFAVFEWLVFDQGMPSNGVGPSQLTWKGYFTSMKAQGLRPWVAYDNMLFGLTILNTHYLANDKDWLKAATLYNGATSYGEDFVAKLAEWQKLFADASPGSGS